jgi:signal transduction histidine kinase
MIAVRHLKAALPFLSLAAALLLSGWAFFRSEHYRAESDLNFSQTYEIQWRTTQIREHLARIHGDLKLAAATGEMESDLARQTFLLNANVGQLLKLDYAAKFLRDRDIQLLRELQAIARSDLDPITHGSTEFGRALRSMPDLEQRMFEVSGTAVAHAEALNTASHIDAAASRNRFLFAAALTLAAVGYTIIHLRNAFARRRDQQLRSFSSLYAHMTRSRVAALRLFLDYQEEASVRHPEMLAAAREAVKQLDTITTGLNTIAYADSDTRREALAKTVEALQVDRRIASEFLVTEDAGVAAVPATQMRLLLDELLQNAEAALSEIPDAKIRVKARIGAQPLTRKRRLVLEVTDNGPGMSEDVLASATLPFYSTKAGDHTGLGLTGCAQMVAALRGKLSIASQPGKGTSVQISLPI